MQLQVSHPLDLNLALSISAPHISLIAPVNTENIVFSWTHQTEAGSNGNNKQWLWRPGLRDVPSQFCSHWPNTPAVRTGCPRWQHQKDHEAKGKRKNAREGRVIKGSESPGFDTFYGRLESYCHQCLAVPVPEPFGAYAMEIWLLLAFPATALGLLFSGLLSQLPLAHLLFNSQHFIAVVSFHIF